MPRGSRLFLDYYCYHIITRGNQKQFIFYDAKDYLKYLELVKRAKRKYHILLYSYCLMPNHVHMLIEALDVMNIPKFMKWVNRGYTAYFNARYDRVGHLWQARYKSKPILKGRYLINCAGYIEANPVRAGITKDIAEYEWSGYNERCLLYDKKLLDEINLTI